MAVAAVDGDQEAGALLAAGGVEAGVRDGDDLPQEGPGEGVVLGSGGGAVEDDLDPVLLPAPAQVGDGERGGAGHVPRSAKAPAGASPVAGGAVIAVSDTSAGAGADTSAGAGAAVVVGWGAVFGRLIVGPLAAVGTAAARSDTRPPERGTVSAMRIDGFGPYL